MPTITALVYRPGIPRGEAEQLDPDDLTGIQRIVGGYIEEVRLSRLVPGITDPALVVICHEEAAITEPRPPANRIGLLGVFLVARVGGEEMASLTAADIEAVRAHLDVAPSASLN